MKFAVTVGLNRATNLSSLAKKWALQLDVPYLARPTKGTLESLLQEYELDALIVATANGPQIFSAEGTLFFHPGMAVLRLKKILAGEKDNFADALELKPGMRVLDCTMGLASDAAIAAYISGESGKVVALEASAPVWFVVSQGLKEYKAEDEQLNSALRRIETIHSTAEEFLNTLPKDAFDVVYFDPMFHRPVSTSSNMTPLRPVAFEKALEKSVIDEALRVAPLVVVKERSTKLLERLGISEFKGGRYSRIIYGIKRR